MSTAKILSFMKSGHSMLADSIDQRLSLSLGINLLSAKKFKWAEKSIWLVYAGAIIPAIKIVGLIVL